MVSQGPKKKVLVIIPDRFVRATGGMGANSLPIFEKLSTSYEFYVVGFPQEGSAPDFIRDYHDVASPYTQVQFGPLNTLLSQARYFAEAISFPKPDIVYAYDWSVYQAATEVADFFGVPLVARMSLSAVLLAHEGYTFGLDLSIRAEKAIHDALCEMEIRGLKRAESIVHISNAYKCEYEKNIPFGDKVRLVYNGIDLEKWQREFAPYQLPGSAKTKVVYLGRLTETKGILELCDARVPGDIDLIIIGPRETASAACVRAVEEKVSREKNIFYIDGLYGEEKIRALRSADAIIVPSLHEPFGTVGLEGLAAGCVVISSRAGGLADYLDDSNSIFCSTTSHGIEAAYQELLKLPKEKKEAMREAGFAVCKKFSIESAAQALDALFSEVTK